MSFEFTHEGPDTVPVLFEGRIMHVNAREWVEGSYDMEFAMDSDGVMQPRKIISNAKPDKSYFAVDPQPSTRESVPVAEVRTNIDGYPSVSVSDSEGRLWPRKVYSTASADSSDGFFQILKGKLKQSLIPEQNKIRNGLSVGLIGITALTGTFILGTSNESKIDMQMTNAAHADGFDDLFLLGSDRYEPPSDLIRAQNLARTMYGILGGQPVSKQQYNTVKFGKCNLPLVTVKAESIAHVDVGNLSLNQVNGNDEINLSAYTLSLPTYGQPRLITVESAVELHAKAPQLKNC